ncbi:hypothetical protein [Escherichia coli]|uniref:hypothetical protein n=1 Tax=Escherichia coli TaxID=562 RepID=UPI0018668C1F|nr:hypothetical protein [Escherichia coli]
MEEARKQHYVPNLSIHKAQNQDIEAKDETLRNTITALTNYHNPKLKDPRMAQPATVTQPNTRNPRKMSHESSSHTERDSKKPSHHSANTLDIKQPANRTKQHPRTATNKRKHPGNDEVSRGGTKTEQIRHNPTHHPHYRGLTRLTIKDTNPHTKDTPKNNATKHSHKHHKNPASNPQNKIKHHKEPTSQQKTTPPSGKRKNNKNQTTKQQKEQTGDNTRK